MSNTTTPTSPRAQNAFERAQRKLRKRLTEKELAQINSVSSVDQLIVKAQTISAYLESNNPSAFSERANNLALNLKPFERLLEGACKLSPKGGDLIWGGVGFLLEAARNKKKILVEVLDFFLDMVNEMKYLQTVEATFGDSSMVADVIEAIYVAILDFWVKAVQYYQQTLRQDVLSKMKNYLLSNNMALEFSQLKEEIAFQQRTLHHRESVQHHTHVELDIAERWAREASKRRQQQIVRQQELVKWIDAPNYESDQRAADRRRYGETCDWLARKPEYADWVERRISSFLVIYGIPGAGKTILSSWIVKQLLARSAGRMTIYHYFKDADNSKNTPLAAIRSLLDQAYSVIRSSSDQTLLSTLEQELVTQSRKTHVVFEPLWDVLSSTLTSFSGSALPDSQPSVTIILDALDECRSSKQLIRCLRRLVRSASGAIRVVATARPSGDHVGGLENANKNEYQPTFLRISQDDVHHDIASFIKYKIGKIPRLQQEKHSKLRNKTIKTFGDVRFHQGMFLWVHFMCKEVRHLQKPKEIWGLLNNMPPGLDAMYERICERLLRNDPRDRRLGLLVLQWVFTSKRPMQFGELEEALRLMRAHADDSQDGQPVDDEDELLWSREDVVKSCGDLVRYSHEGDTFAPVHVSAQQFFSTVWSNLSRQHPRASPDIIGPFLVDRPTTELTIATTCLKYLISTSDPGHWLAALDTDHARRHSRDDFQKSYPLFDYSVVYWADYMINRLEARGELNDDSIRQLLETVTEFTRSHASLTWLEEYIHLTYIEFAQNTILRFTALKHPVMGAEVSSWFRMVMNVLFDFPSTLSNQPQMVRRCVQQMQVSTPNEQHAKDESIKPLGAIRRGWIHYDTSTDNLFSADATSDAPKLRCQIMKTGVRRKPLPAIPHNRSHQTHTLHSAAISPCSYYVAVMYRSASPNDFSITCWNINYTDTVPGTSDWANVIFNRRFFSLYLPPSDHLKASLSSGLAFDSGGTTLLSPDGVFSLENQERSIEPDTIYGPAGFQLFVSGDGGRFVRANSQRIEVVNIDSISVVEHELRPGSSVKCFSYRGTKLVYQTEWKLICFQVDEGSELELLLPFNDWTFLQLWLDDLQFTKDDTKLFAAFGESAKWGLGVWTFLDNGDTPLLLIYIDRNPFVFCLVSRLPNDSDPDVLIVEHMTGTITRRPSNVGCSLDVNSIGGREPEAIRGVVVESGPAQKLVVWSLFVAADLSYHMMHIQSWNLQTQQLELLSQFEGPMPDQLTIETPFTLSPGGDRLFDGSHIVEARIIPKRGFLDFGICELGIPHDRILDRHLLKYGLAGIMATFSEDGTRLACYHTHRDPPMLHVFEIAAGPQVTRKASFPLDDYYNRMSEVVFSHRDPDLLAIGQYILRFQDESLVVHTETDGDVVGFSGCGLHYCVESSNGPKLCPLEADMTPRVSAKFIPPTSLPVDAHYICAPYMMEFRRSQKVTYLRRKYIDEYHDEAHFDRSIAILPDRLDFPTGGDDVCDLVWPIGDDDNLKLVLVRKGVPEVISTGIKKDELMLEDEWVRHSQPNVQRRRP